MSNKEYRIGFKLHGDASGGVKAMKDVRDATKHTTNAADKHATANTTLAATQDSVTGAVREYGAALLSAVGIAASTAFVQANYEAVAAQVDLSKQLGVSYSKLQAYGHAAKSADVDSTEFAETLRDMSIRIDEYINIGTGEAADIFEQLSLNVEEFRNLRPDEQFFKVAEALEKVNSEGEKRVYLDQLGSDNLVKLLPLLEDGGAEFKSLFEEALGFSTALTDIEAVSIKQAFNETQELKSALESAGGYLVAGFAPAISESASELEVFFRNSQNVDAIVATLGVTGAAAAAVYAGKLTSSIYIATAARVKDSAAARKQAVDTLASAKAAQEQARYELTVATAMARSAKTVDQKTAAMKRAQAAAVTYKGVTDQLTAAQARYNAVAGAGARAMKGLRGGLRLLGGPAGLLLTAASAFTIFSSNADDAKDSSNELSLSIDSLAGSLDVLTKNQARQALIDLKASMEDLETQAAVLAGKAGGQLDVMNTGIPTSSDAYKEASANRTKLLAELDLVQGKLNEKVKLQADLQKVLNGTYEKSSTVTDKVTGGASNLAQQHDDLLKSLFPLEAKQSEYNEKLKQLEVALDKTSAGDDRRKAALLALKKQYVELFPTLEKQIEAEKELAKQAEKDKKARESRIKSNKDLLIAMRGEIELLGMTERERFVETQMRKLSAEATDEQREALRRLSGQIYDQQNVVDEYAKIWEDAGERIDKSIADMWTGGIDSLKDAGAEMKATLKSILGELAHIAITKPLLISLGVTGQGSGGSLGSAIQSLFSGGGTPGTPFSLDPSSIISGVSGFFNSSSVGEGLASGLGQVLDFAGVQTNSGIGSFLADASNSLGTTSNLAMGLGGIGGSLLSGALGLSGEYSGVTGSIGTAVGAALLTPILGPLAPFVGSFIGDALGGLIGNSEPSNKEGNASVNWDSDAITQGGQTGNKFSQENRDAASALASNINGMIGALELLSGNQSTTNYTVGVGDRDGKYINYQGHNDSSVQRLVTSDDPEALLNAAAQHFAAELQVDTAIFKQLQQSGEVITDTIQRVVSETYALHGSLEQLGLVDVFSAESAKITQALIDQAGGAEALAAGASTFYNAFYTEEEKFQQAADSVAAQFETMSLVVPETREQFRALVESLDLTTDAGQSQAAQLLAMAPAMDQYYTQLKSIEGVSIEAAGSVSELASNLHKLAADSATQTLDVLGAINTFNESGALGQAIAAEQQRLAGLQQSENSLFQEQQKRYQAAIQGEQTIQQFLQSLQLGDLSTLTAGEQQAEARHQFDSAIASGDASAATKAASAYLQIVRDNYASGAQYQDAFKSVNTQLGSLGSSLSSVPSPTGGARSGGSSTSETLEKLLTEQVKTNALQQELQQLINATTVAEKIGDLGLAQDTSVFGLADRFGLNMGELAQTLGVQVSEIDGSMVGAISAMSELLHVTNRELLEGLGADITAIPESIQDQLFNADKNANEQQDLINSEIDVMRSVLDEVERGNSDSVSAIDRVTEAVNTSAERISQSVREQVDVAVQSSRDADVSSRENANAIERLARRMDQLAATLETRVA